MSKYSEAGKGSTNKLKQKKLYDDNYDQVFGKKEVYFDSDETTDWDEDRLDIIGTNGNTGDHYIKWLSMNVRLNGLYQALTDEWEKKECLIEIKESMI